MGRQSSKQESIEFSYGEEVRKRKSLIREILTSDIKAKGKNDSQTKLIRSIKENEMTICSGVAGCGKTYMTLTQGLRMLKAESSPYNSMYLVKSVTTLKEEDLGFLKGDKHEKFDPYMMSYYINIDKLISKDKRNKLLAESLLIPQPLAYIRGATIDNSIIIVDEAQNITINNIRTLMTRIGQNSRMIIIGDENQIDLKNRNESCLKILLDRFNDVDGIGVVRMDENDVNIRNPLITKIENKFKIIVEENGK